MDCGTAQLHDWPVSVAEVTAKNRDLNHKSKQKTTIRKSCTCLSPNPLVLEREKICGQCPRHFYFSAAVMNLTIAGQFCFEAGERKGVLLTRPGEGTWVSPSFLNVATSAYALGIYEEGARSFSVSPSLKSTPRWSISSSKAGILCLVHCWIPSSSDSAWHTIYTQKMVRINEEMPQIFFLLRISD